MRFDQSFRIGTWRVQPQLNRISDDERFVQIEPKMMQVLLRLAEEPGQVVARRELLDAVWPDTVVGEEVLSRAVSELRKAFGDDARDPSVIETIRKSGYRLIAAVDFEITRGDEVPRVSITGETADSESGRSTAGAVLAGFPGEVVEASERRSKGSERASKASERRSAASERRPISWPLRIGGIAMTTVILLIAAYVLVERPSGKPQVAFRAVPATTFRGTEFHPALSPDGKHLAFIWTGPDHGHLDLYVKALASETLLQHTDGPFYEFSPSWSPDGTEIVFGRFGTGVSVVPALGGPERKLTAVEASARPQVDWSPTGETIAYTDREGANRPYRLHLVSSAGDAKRVLTSPPTTYEGDSAPSFSPDGKRIAFARTSSGAADVYVLGIDEDDAVPRRLTFDAAEINGVAWSEDGRHVVFASTRGGGSVIWRVPHTGGEPELVVSAPGSDLLQPSLAAGRLAYTQTTTDANIWRQRPDEEPVALIASTRIDANPDYSPDENRIAFVSSRSGTMELWTVAADGSQPIKLTSFDGTSVSKPHWSPDGSLIAFDAGVMGQSDIYVIRPEDRHLWRITTNDGADQAPSWSQDGERLYFASNRSGTWEIWSAPAASGMRFVDASTPVSRQWTERSVQATHGGGTFASEAPDGSLLVTRRGQPGLHRLAPDGRDSVLVDDLALADGSNWALVEDRLYYVDQSGQSVNVHDLSSGSTRMYLELTQGPYRGRPDLAVSPAGDVLYTRVDHSTFDIMVSDWR